ncbi:hypothetical protein PHYPO_G00156450 [Pangasianodon hypophthalmus]|uniref:Uncharacterized protein n=1 Tax=Pangasianodon hypophthalmus TaxID=310915 RepID=A0A5N5JX03_PANHP|nr:hypothetical protein PHYPO_G00156450 [Pangasianodon hypophthalmus]
MIDRRRVCGRSFLEECVSLLGYSREDVEAVQEVMVAVETGEEFGINLQDLYRKCTHLEQVEKGRSKTLQQYIQDLLDCEKVLEVGALSPRLVCMDFAVPWLLQCPKVSEEPCPSHKMPHPPPLTSLPKLRPPPQMSPLKHCLLHTSHH